MDGHKSQECATGERAAMLGGSVMARSSKGLGPENYGLQEGEADSQGSGHAVRRLRIDSRHGCIEGINVLLSSPSPCSVACLGRLVLHSPAYSRDAEDDTAFEQCPLPGQDERKRSTWDVPAWDGRDERPSATCKGNFALGSLSTGSLIGHLLLSLGWWLNVQSG
jgi:hypothetical protein